MDILSLLHLVQTTLARSDISLVRVEACLKLLDSLPLSPEHVTTSDIVNTLEPYRLPLQSWSGLFVQYLLSKWNLLSYLCLAPDFHPINENLLPEIVLPCPIPDPSPAVGPLSPPCLSPPFPPWRVLRIPCLMT